MLVLNTKEESQIIIKFQFIIFNQLEFMTVFNEFYFNVVAWSRWFWIFFWFIDIQISVSNNLKIINSWIFYCFCGCKKMYAEWFAKNGIFNIYGSLINDVYLMKASIWSYDIICSTSFMNNQLCKPQNNLFLNFKIEHDFFGNLHFSYEYNWNCSS